MFGISLGGSLGIAAIIAAIVGLILKKTGLREKIVSWTEKAKLPESGFSKAAIVSGNNSGVATTTWFNKIPVVNIIYESSLENLVILVVECVIGLIIHFVSLFVNNFVVGMRSDNKKFKTKKNPKGK